jgi:hypothetical protein
LRLPSKVGCFGVISVRRRSKPTPRQAPDPGAAAVVAAAVLAYRVILFWLPLLAGAVAFFDLRRDMPQDGELATCEAAAAAAAAR